MKPTLLFVDDDADVSEAFSDLFEMAGWTVACARDGLEALDWLATHPPPEVVVLDLKMPTCDGYEFRRRQLADPRLKDLPTVVFTADAHVEAVHSSLLAAVPIVRKSAEFTQLLATIERVRGRPGG